MAIKQHQQQQQKNEEEKNDNFVCQKFRRHVPKVNSKARRKTIFSMIESN